MTIQTEIDFTARRENNPESQAILEANKDSINTQCKMIKAMLESGYRLTVRDAMINYGISSLPRRILDLKNHGMEIKSKLINGKYKEYFI
jgi:hypothetical protein